MNPMAYATTFKPLAEWIENREDGTSGIRTCTNLDPVPPDGDGWSIVAMTVDPISSTGLGRIYWSWHRATSAVPK